MSASRTTRGLIRRFLHLAVLVAVFVSDVVSSSVRIAINILTPSHRMSSGVIAIPLDLETDFQITTLANIISLMPGTLTLDVSGDRRTLFVHVMDIGGEDVEAHQDAIKRRLERRIRKVFG